MTDSMIEKATAVATIIRKGKTVAANDEDDYNLYLFAIEILKVEPKAIFKFKKKRLLIKML